MVSKYVFSMLSRMGYAEARKTASPLTRGRPLIDSPTPMITLAAAYLLIVILGTLAHKIKGPRKQKIDPLWLRVLVQVHNTFLVILSSYMSFNTAYCAWKYSYRFWGQGYSSSEKDMGWIIYVFFLSKIYEFMDTVSQHIHNSDCYTTQTNSNKASAPAVHYVAERQNRTNHVSACLPPWYHFCNLVRSFVAAAVTAERHRSSTAVLRSWCCVSKQPVGDCACLCADLVTRHILSIERTDRHVLWKTKAQELAVLTLASHLAQLRDPALLAGGSLLMALQEEMVRLLQSSPQFRYRSAACAVVP